MENIEDRSGQSKEEFAVVLDFLPNGYPADNRPMHLKTAIAQAIGKSNFTILELVPKKDIFMQPHEDVYIGDGKRDKVHHIKGKLTYDHLTATAKSELEYIVKELITANEQRFVDFFNTARPLTTRMHQLELLPGLGKKHMWQIIEERDISLFKNFEDLKTRVKLITDPEKLIQKRIMAEIEGKEKHMIFIQG